MKKFLTTALVLSIAIAATGCRKDDSLNKAGLTNETYQASGVTPSKMTFPGKDNTVFKAGGKFKDPQLPQPYKQPGTWVVYMAAPGWTNGGKPIVDRLATDAVAISIVKQFLIDNRLRDKVKVAWLQYDPNPGARFMDGLKLVPDNFIPLFLKPHGPEVDYYIYSPASRHGNGDGSMRYDRWLKPYLPFAKKEGAEYVAANAFHRDVGFNNADGKYWDSWARHWFVVDPQGTVVDAYFSNLGTYNVQGADKPINSLIHHLKLDSAALQIPKIITTNYNSFYTPPYWDKLDHEFREQIGLTEKEL
ncbi:hypothetical protein [Pseudomonas syringae]|uniref:hypothetical protein n=1 Tax=Pseudomonas syringae TaxID=317 RepID=UPI001F1850E2|nr:hypothetical protein [Pseudomonas syringae]MCF5374174.1 hypothetical protein [Pseudomonas syringae]